MIFWILSRMIYALCWLTAAVTKYTVRVQFLNEEEYMNNIRNLQHSINEVISNVQNFYNENGIEVKKDEVPEA